jgi:hypothetical protein
MLKAVKASGIDAKHRLAPRLDMRDGGGQRRFRARQPNSMYSASIGYRLNERSNPQKKSADPCTRVIMHMIQKCQLFQMLLLAHHISPE